MWAVRPNYILRIIPPLNSYIFRGGRMPQNLLKKTAVGKSELFPPYLNTLQKVYFVKYLIGTMSESYSIKGPVNE